MKKTNIDFPHFVWIWNHCQFLKTPRMHLEIARWFNSRWLACDQNLLLLAFRNSGKSTLVGLYCAWLLFRNRNYRILVLAADHALATKMVRNVKRIIERHPLTTGLKPSRADQWASDQFTVQRSIELRDPSMLAKGIGANITGIRADFVICDDVEVPNTCDTQSKRRNLRTRLQEIEYVLVPGGFQVYIGTPHTFHSIYAKNGSRQSEKEKYFLEGFHRLEIPIFDAEGNSRWPERFSVSDIEGIKKRSGVSKFESQMNLRPTNIIDGRLSVAQLKRYDDELFYAESNNTAFLSISGRRLVSASCWWDPSYGSPEKGDASVIASIYTDSCGDYWLHKINYLVHDPASIQEMDEATQMCRQVVGFVRNLFIPSVSIETNGLGRFLPGLLRRELSLTNVSCAVLERTTHRNKDIRIIDAFEAIMAAGRLHVHQGIWDTPFIEEMREWRPGCNSQDDGLDAVAGCLLDEPVRLPLSIRANGVRTVNPGAWRQGGSIVKVEHDFPI